MNEVTRDNYPHLFEAVDGWSKEYDTTTVNLPDLKSEFIRGVDMSQNQHHSAICVYTGAVAPTTWSAASAGAISPTLDFTDRVTACEQRIAELERVVKDLMAIKEAITAPPELLPAYEDYIFSNPNIGIGRGSYVTTLPGSFQAEDKKDFDFTTKYSYAMGIVK